MILVHVTAAEAMDNSRLRLAFSNGRTGELG